MASRGHWLGRNLDPSQDNTIRLITNWFITWKVVCILINFHQGIFLPSDTNDKVICVTALVVWCRLKNWLLPKQVITKRVLALTRWGRDILQTTFSHPFYCMKIHWNFANDIFKWMKAFIFSSKFHWSLFSRAQWTVTVKPVCNDHLYYKIYFPWFIQWCVLMKTDGTNLLLLTIPAFWGSSRWPLAT